MDKIRYLNLAGLLVELKREAYRLAAPVTEERVARDIQLTLEDDEFGPRLIRFVRFLIDSKESGEENPLLIDDRCEEKKSRS